MEKENITKAFDNTPPQLKSYIESKKWKAGSEALAKAAGVPPHHVDNFVDEVLLTLLGLEDASTFRERLIATGIDTDKARQLNQNIYGSIFHNLISEIEETKKKNVEAEEEDVYELGDMPEEYHGKFAALPEDVKEAIGSVNSAEKIRQVAKKHQLHIDQVGELGTQTGLVMLGVLPPRDFVKALTDKLQVTPEVARAIAADINTEIFNQIRESLKRIHHLDFGGESSAAPTPTPIKEVPPTSVFATKTSEAVAVNKPEAVITPTDLANKPKKEFDPYREPIG